MQKNMCEPLDTDPQDAASTMLMQNASVSEVFRNI